MTTARACFYEPVRVHMVDTDQTTMRFLDALAVLRSHDHYEDVTDKQLRDSLKRKSEFFDVSNDVVTLRTAGKKAAPKLSYAPLPNKTNPLPAASSVVWKPTEADEIDEYVRRPRTFVVASWNLGGAAGTGCEKNIAAVRAVCTAIMRENPDVVVMQETPAELHASFPLARVDRYVFFKSAQRTDHSFLVSRRLRVTACDILSDVKGAGNFTKQHAVKLVVRTPDGSTYSLVSVHAPTTPRFRLEYFKSLYQCVKEDPIVLLCGDFNQQVHLEPVEALPGFSFTGDRWTKTTQASGYDFFGYVPQPTRTFSQHSIEQVAKRGEVPTIAGASDHDPVVLTVRARAA